MQSHDSHDIKEPSITFHLTQPLYLLYLTYVPLLSTTFHMRMQHGVHPELQRRRLADLGPIWSRAPKARVRGVRARARRKLRSAGVSTLKVLSIIYPL